MKVPSLRSHCVPIVRTEKEKTKTMVSGLIDVFSRVTLVNLSGIISQNLYKGGRMLRKSGGFHKWSSLFNHPAIGTPMTVETPIRQHPANCGSPVSKNPCPVARAHGQSRSLSPQTRPPWAIGEDWTAGWTVAHMLQYGWSMFIHVYPWEYAILGSICKLDCSTCGV